MRSNSEIQNKISELEVSGDPTNFKKVTLAMFLPYEMVKEHLDDSITEEIWKEEQEKINLAEEIKDTLETLIHIMKHRELKMLPRAAGKFQILMWLYGDDNLVEGMLSPELTGQPLQRFALVCNHFGWDLNELSKCGH